MTWSHQGWVVVWEASVSMAVIFGVVVSYAAFFESFATGKLCVVAGRFATCAAQSMGAIHLSRGVERLLRMRSITWACRMAAMMLRPRPQSGLLVVSPRSR